MSHKAQCPSCGDLHQVLRCCNATDLKQATMLFFEQGEFAYASIMSRRDDETLFICKHCSLFYKRIVSSPTLRNKKRYLPIDQVFSFILDPSSVPVPDIRVLRRVLSSCQRNKNVPFSNLFLSFPRIKSMLHMISNKIKHSHGKLSDIDAVAMVWWEMNGKPILFKNVSTAKYVRQAMKKHLQLS